MKTLNEKETKLLKELQKEADKFAGRGQSTKEHDLAIHYLKTGEVNADTDKYDLLYAVVHDFDCLYIDYCA